MIAPVLDEISLEYSDKITVAKLNIDDNPATPSHYGVRGIPTLMLFKDGDVEATKISGCFRSTRGAEIFCRVRGYLATCRKQGVSATQAMELVFEGRLPELAL
jgi:hypothetical protein